MRQFTAKPGRLPAMAVEVRAVYSVFLLLTLAALAITLWLAHEMVGWDLSSVDAYYAGKDSMPVEGGEPAALDAEAGPALELPPELDAPLQAEPMPRRKLLEVTHFHLFSMPVYLLVLAHLYALSTASRREKLWWIGEATIATVGHVAAPWIAAAGAAMASLWYGVSGALLLVSYLVMCVVALREMWLSSS